LNHYADPDFWEGIGSFSDFRLKNVRFAEVYVHWPRVTQMVCNGSGSVTTPTTTA
jgi:hypothetical protein